MDYQVIVVSDVREQMCAIELQQKVDSLIKLGWQPQGGVSVSVSESRSEIGLSPYKVVMTQALIHK